MTAVTRRQFLGVSARLAALLGLGSSAVPRVAEALEQISRGQAPVLWLQAMSCSGCSVSLLNSESPGPQELLTSHLSLLFHSTLTTATGHQAIGMLKASIQEGGFLLVVEGSIPAEMPRACMVGEEPIDRQVARAAQRARAVVCAGSCAAHGGIPAADNNPTGALSVPDFLAREGISTPVIRLPGCPAHPDWLVSTLVHLLKFGLPPLDSQGRPTMFYGRMVHDRCPRFADYERQRFAASFGDDGCLFQLGCLGPNTHADCTVRLWNGGTNSCINAGAPCIGCASEHFARRTGFPFYTKTVEGGAEE